MTHQTTDQSANIAGPGNVRAAARGLVDLVPAMMMTKLDRSSNGIIASPVPTAWDSRFTSLHKPNQPGTCAMFILVSQITGKSNAAIRQMQQNKNAVKSAIPTVPTVVKTMFALKKRPLIAAKGLLKGTFIVAVHESGGVGDNEFSRIHTAVEGTDAKGNRFEVPKDYNTLPNRRGVSAFVDDYNSWSGAGLTEDDMYNEFDCDAMVKGKPVVVEIGHRKNGKEWDAVIEAFHPADYTEPVAAAELTATADAATVA